MGDDNAAAAAAKQIPAPEEKEKPGTNKLTSIAMSIEPAAPDIIDDEHTDAAKAVASENGNHNTTATAAAAAEPTPDAPASKEDTTEDKPACTQVTATEEEKVEEEASAAEKKGEQANAGVKVGTDAPQPVSNNKEVKAAAHLSAPVRARLDEVLHSAEDKPMLEDARLINFLSEVEESQVCFEVVVKGCCGSVFGGWRMGGTDYLFLTSNALQQMTGYNTPRPIENCTCDFLKERRPCSAWRAHR